MYKHLLSSFKKNICLLLAVAFLFQAEAPVFAETLSFAANSEQALQVSEKIDEAFLQAEEESTYYSELKSLVNQELKKLQNSAEAKKISSLKATGKSKYGNLWPMYVEAGGKKAIESLENQLQHIVGAVLSEPKEISFKQYEKEYNAFLHKNAAEEVKNKNITFKPPYKSAEDAVFSRLSAEFPVKNSYKEYKKDVKQQLAWRNKNKVKIEELAYNAAKEGIKQIGAENLSNSFIFTFYNLTLNGKKVLSTEDINALYNYHVLRLEKQQLDIFDFGALTGRQQKEVAAVLLVNIMRSIQNVALLDLRSSSKKRFSKAVENLIYRSEDTAAFNEILSIGFSALLAQGEYSALERVLKHFTDKDTAGNAWYDYLSVQTIVNEFNGDKFLGPVSEKTYYTTDVQYRNTFTDIGLLLAEESSPERTALIKKFAGGDLNKNIKPFVFGVLRGRHHGLPENTAAEKASALANMSFGDINATYEFDVDTALLNRYPAIKNKLGKYAITTKQKQAEKRSDQKRFAYLQRAALSTDIYLIVVGTIGFAKLGKSFVSLSKSTYTAMKAARIPNTAKRISYIRANYAKLTPYISTKRTFLNLSSKIKMFLRKPIETPEELRTIIKIENAVKAQEVEELGQTAAQMRAAAQESGSAADLARAQMTQAAYESEAARLEAARQVRTESFRSFLNKYQDFTFRRLQDPTAAFPTMTYREWQASNSLINFAEKNYIFGKSVENYLAHLNKFERFCFEMKNKISDFFNISKYYTFQRPLGPAFYTASQSTYAPFAVASEAQHAVGLLPASEGIIFSVPAAGSFVPQINWASLRPNLSLTQGGNLLPLNSINWQNIPLQLSNLTKNNARVGIAAALGTGIILNPIAISANNPSNMFSLPPIAPIELFAPPAPKGFYSKYIDITANSDSSPAALKNNGSYSKYIADVGANFDNKIAAAQTAEFDIGKQKYTIPQLIAFIEEKSPNSGITLKRYQDDLQRLRSLAPNMVLPLFDNLLEKIANGKLLQKIVSAQNKSKPKKLDEFIDQYNNALNYVETYLNAMSTPAAQMTNNLMPFYSVHRFPKLAVVDETEIKNSIETVNEIEFTKRMIKTMFSSQSLLNALSADIDRASPEHALQVSRKLNDLYFKTQEMTNGGIARKNIKGCIINQGGVWDTFAETMPIPVNRLGLSVEYQYDFANKITEWIQKNHIPVPLKELKKGVTKNYIPETILENVVPWIKNILSISDEFPAHYVEFYIYDGFKEVHVYNHNYTARLRLGKHELSEGNPHLHLEFLENSSWTGIRNESYLFNVGTQYLPQIHTFLKGLQTAFKPADSPELLAVKSLMPSPKEKVLYILGGPNASGKTRLYNTLFSDKHIPFLNQDLISEQQGLSTLDAGRVLLTQMENLFNDGNSFILESTLSGRGVIPVIRQAKENNYKVMIIYTFVKDAETSIQRAFNRVMEGGHSVPFEELESRYIKSRQNFWNVYKDRADQWIMFFSGETEIIPIASQQSGKEMEILHEELFTENQINWKPHLQLPARASLPEGL